MDDVTPPAQTPAPAANNAPAPAPALNPAPVPEPGKPEALPQVKKVGQPKTFSQTSYVVAVIATVVIIIAIGVLFVFAYLKSR